MMPEPPNQPTSRTPASARQDRPLLSAVRRTIDHHGMLNSGDRVLVAVSGGPDSVALLSILHHLTGAYRLHLAAAHLDHGLRPETAAGEAELVRRLASRFGLSLYTDRLPPPPDNGSLEAWLRDKRYAFLETTAAAHGLNKIALGHQADDNAEALLLNLLRGSGMRGISGIPPVRNGRVVRPLIDLRRCQILAYLERHGLAYLEDPSNRDLRFDRNRLRHQLIPTLEKEYNANLIEVLNRTARICYEEDHWLDEHLAAPQLKRALMDMTATRMVLNARMLRDAAPPLQRRVLRLAFRRWQGHLRRVTAEHIERLRDLIAGHERHRSLHLPGRIEVLDTSDTLRFQRWSHHLRYPKGEAAESHKAVDERHTIEAAGRLPAQVVLPLAGLRLTFSPHPVSEVADWRRENPGCALFDLDRLNFPLIVRNPRPGDRFTPFGMQGTQRLKVLFINRKIPVRRRRRIPVVEMDGAILWVVGVRRGDPAPITPETERVLRIEATPLHGIGR